MSDRRTHINTHTSIFGANISVVKKVRYQIIASCFSIFHALCNGLNRIMFMTAKIIIAARVATGKYDNIGVKNSKVIQTIHPVMTDVRPVRAQALRLTAVLLRLHATAYHQNKLDVIFASPCPISSRFGLSGFFVAYDTYFATDIDCVNPIRAIIIEKINNLKISWKLRIDTLVYKKLTEIWGSWLGIFPTTAQL